MRKYSQQYTQLIGRRNGRNFRWKFWPFIKISKEPIPTIDDTVIPQFEHELFEAAESEIIRISEKWKQTDQYLKTNYCKAVIEHKDAHESYEKEVKEAITALNTFERIKGQLEELTAPSLSAFWTLFLLICIAIAEFPLNSIAFQIFGASMIETIVMTASIMLIFPFAAHFFGKSLKQNHHKIKDIIIIIVTPLVIFGLIGAISIFRESLFETLQTKSFLRINMAPKTAMILFVLINIAIFFVATLIAYEGAYPDHAGYRTIRKIYKTALLSHEKESTEAKKAAKRLWDANHSLEENKQKRSKVHERMYEQAKIIMNSYDWLVRCYRNANMSVRDNAIIPKCFKDRPQLPEIPELLDPKKLDWDCKFHEKNPSHANPITLN
jgi:hypothetical protein